MNLAHAILEMCPDADLSRHVKLQDDSDGKGPYIAKWDEKALGRPKPTPEELEQAEAEYVPSAKKPSLEDGEAGYYADGNSNITWDVEGTRVGNVN